MRLGAEPSVILIDDDHAFVDSTRDYAQLKGCRVHAAASVQDALQLASRCATADLMLVDVSLPDGTGFDVLERLHRANYGDIVMLTGRADLDAAIRSVRLGVDDYLVKPIYGEHLDALLHKARRRADARATDLALAADDDMLGASAPMQRVRDLIRRVAGTDESVLIHGESGTGKELVARAIHRASGRSGAFVAVNCGALPGELLGSELFGHERGSFTGAVRTHVGVIEQAQHGTLFLDEFTEMPATMQTYLLRVIEQRSVTRLGSQQAKPVDFRIVASTNRDPLQAVRDGLLREDLYYRLCAFPIAVPPLRERAGDAWIIARQFLERLNRRHGSSVVFDADAQASIEACRWPGNVRQLDHTIRRAYLLSDGHVLSLSDAMPRDTRIETSLWRGQTLDSLEREAIEAALRQTGNDKTRAARLLGISVKTIYNKVERYRVIDGKDAQHR